MKKNLCFTLFGFCLLLLIKSSVQVEPIERSPSSSSQNTFRSRNALLETLTRRRNEVKSWAAKCQDQQQVYLFEPPIATNNVKPYLGQYSGAFHACDQGDMMIYAGFPAFAAWFAGDQEWALKQHEDLRRSQKINGQFTRGPSFADHPSRLTNTFSRDQATGLALYFVVGLDRIRAETRPYEKQNLINRYQREWTRWIKWIDDNSGGRQMCEGDQRCTLSGHTSALIYRIGLKLGAINDENKSWTAIKKLKRHDKLFRGFEFAAETKLTPVDYQMLLKVAGVFVDSYLGYIDPKWLKIAELTMHAKDPQSELFDFLYQGVTSENAYDLLSKCPTSPPNPNEAYFFWKFHSDKRPWEHANGHDCLTALNLMIADLKGNLKWLARDTAETDCPFSYRYIDTYRVHEQNYPLCRHTAAIKISKARCLSTNNRENGRDPFIYTKNGAHECALPKENFYKLRPLGDECPGLKKYLGDYKNELPVCRNAPHVKISARKCAQGGYETYRSPIDGKTYCVHLENDGYHAREIK